jgi:hypothetical protein
MLAMGVRAGEVERHGIQSYGVRAAYGIGDRHNITFYSLLPRLSLFVPECIDQPLVTHGLQAEFIIEPIVSYITNSSDTVEAGVNPLFFSLRYDRGQALVPFIEGGEGVLYTDLRGEGLGERFQFSSQAGGGLHWFLSRSTALTVSYRIRHISDAGLTAVNRGLNTDFFMVGLSVFPKR